MGRAQLKMEPITCKKARERTFVKKRHSMVKKARELSILCDVPVLVLLNGPSDSDHYFPTEVWPPDRAMVESMLWKYLSTNLEARAKGSTGLRHILEARNKKAEKDLEGLMKKNKGKIEGSRVSDDGFDGGHDVDRMKKMIGCLDRKIEAVKERIRELKEIKGSDHGVSLPSSSPVVDDGNEIVFDDDEGMGMDDLWDLIDEDTVSTNADLLDIGTHDDVTVKKDGLLSMTTGNGPNGDGGRFLMGFDDRLWMKNPMHLDSYYEENVQNGMWYRQSAIAPSWPQYYETVNDFDGSMGCNVHSFLTNSGLQLQMDDELRLMLF